MTSLYDMDIVFDPPGSGMFTEVYLYEEQMEADLHAIVGQLSQFTTYLLS
jgi:mitogen-activated protein kinase 7